MTTQDQEMELLLTAIDILPEDTARVLRLHYGAQLPLKEICMVMGKSISIVRNHQKRGIFLLKKHFNRKEEKTSISSQVS
jgi:RNA polymerase sigma factor (sigma-70 family)